MPKAGMAMEKGVIVAWLKEIGEKVEFGEPILEIETDKTTMQVEAMSEGYLLSKLYDAGDEVPVITTIGYIGQLGEEFPHSEEIPAQSVPSAAKTQPSLEAKFASIAPTAGRILATPAARRLARERGVKLEDIPAVGIIHARDIPIGKAVKATPLAKRQADARGIDLGGIRGSGHGGKVFSADLTSSNKGNPQKLSGMRRTIAARMLRSHTEIPPVTLNSEADITELYTLRQQFNQLQGVKITFNDLVVKACATALREFPGINASFTEEGIVHHEQVNIGIAVGLDDGLIVPVLKNADELSLKALSAKAKALAEKARGGKLLPDEYSGGTFTISNLGMFGITSFTPIINLPEACILGVCAINDRLALAADGTVQSRKYLGLSLTHDHRCVDGAGGAKFLQRLAWLLENPAELLI